VHVNRWGDGSAHLHLWFLARPFGRLQLRGTFLSLWDDILPPVPEGQWRENLAYVGAWLAEFGGRAMVEAPHIDWQSAGSLDDPEADAEPKDAFESNADGAAFVGEYAPEADVEGSDLIVGASASTPDLHPYVRTEHTTGPDGVGVVQDPDPLATVNGTADVVGAGGLRGGDGSAGEGDRPGSQTVHAASDVNGPPALDGGGNAELATASGSANEIVPTKKAAKKAASPRKSATPRKGTAPRKAGSKKALAAEAAPKGEVPNGEVPNGEVPNGEVPNGEVPNGTEEVGEGLVDDFAAADVTSEHVVAIEPIVPIEPSAAIEPSVATEPGVAIEQVVAIESFAKTGPVRSVPAATPADPDEQWLDADGNNRPSVHEVGTEGSSRG
jgi:hypothetical protein